MLCKGLIEGVGWGKEKFVSTAGRGERVECGANVWEGWGHWESNNSTACHLNSGLHEEHNRPKVKPKNVNVL